LLSRKLRRILRTQSGHGRENDETPVGLWSKPVKQG